MHATIQSLLLLLWCLWLLSNSLTCWHVQQPLLPLVRCLCLHAVEHSDVLTCPATSPATAPMSLTPVEHSAISPAAAPMSLNPVEHSDALKCPAISPAAALMSLTPVEHSCMLTYPITFSVCAPVSLTAVEQPGMLTCPKTFFVSALVSLSAVEHKCGNGIRKFLSTNVTHMKENLSFFSVQLSDQDIDGHLILYTTCQS